MFQVIPYKGSKRRMRQILWKPREVISVVALSLIALVLCVLLGLWEVSQYSAETENSPEPETHHVEATH
jgi:hypothetical protein